MSTNTQSQGRLSRLMTSITARMFMVGILILLLLIPLSFIQSLIRERMYRQEEVVKEINQQWGKEVLLYGPILKIPYKVFKESRLYSEKTKKYYIEKEEFIKYIYVFPKTLNINTTINPQEKKRGIYTTAVYKSNIDISGSFAKPELEINKKHILWNEATLVMQTSNLKGVNSKAEILFNEKAYSLISKYNEDNIYMHNLKMHELESKSLKIKELSDDKDANFSITMNVNGSKQIRFIPIGKETLVNVKSDWKTANFLGEYLPYNENKITENGFDAKWKILDINRAFPQQYKNELPNLHEYTFGVNFMIPVDEYAKSNRSTKYGLLVIALTFLAFFLIQTMSKIRIHPFQYMMIGIALTMFYTLLISISEHSSFLTAYIIAGISVVVLISLYSKSILKGVKFPIFIGLSLTALYTFIFVIIQLENYALLVGSIGLFAILAFVMYISRKIDWQNG